MSVRPCRGDAVRLLLAHNQKETAMPIFEYVCTRCTNQFEELVFGQDETAVCPSCGSTETKKLMSCCRAKVGGVGDDAPAATASAPARSGGGCAGCSGGSCSTCG